MEDQRNTSSLNKTQSAVAPKKAKSMANETSLTTENGSARSDRSEYSASQGASGNSLGSTISERAPEFVQDVVQYLENNWGLRRVEKVAAALGIGSTMDLSKITAMAPSWEAIKRRVTAKPAQTAALVVAGVGLILIARELMADDISSATEEKLHH